MEKFFLISNLKVIFFQTYDFFGKLYDPKMAHLIFGSAIKFHIILPIYIFGGINAGFKKTLARSFTYELPTNFHISNPNCHIFKIKYFEKKLISHFNMDSQVILGQKLSHFVRERAKRVSRPTYARFCPRSGTRN